MTFQAHGLVSANIITWLFANCSDLDASTETVTKRCCAKKGVLQTFAKFTGKHLRQILFFNKFAD